MVAPVATRNTSTAPRPTLPRLTEEDADWRALHAATVRRLHASLRRYVRDLRDNPHPETLMADFIARHTRLLAEAYATGHHEGAKDYYATVSQKRAPKVTIHGQRAHQTLAFYAPSVAKMAREGVEAARMERRWQAAKTGRQLSDGQPANPDANPPARWRYPEAPLPANQPPTSQTGQTPQLPPLPMDGQPANPDANPPARWRYSSVPMPLPTDPTQWPLSQWYQGLDVRVTLQADLGWAGMQDGYAQAGGEDGANPYQFLWWTLGPVLTEHCFPAGTPIETATGAKPIEAIQVGDEVWTHEGRPRRVTTLMRHAYTGVMFTVSTNTHMVTATGNHPFAVQGDEGIRWVRADQLRIFQDRLLTGIERRPDRFNDMDVRWEADVPVYNFEVEEDHSYIAGGFVVHNCDTCLSLADGSPYDPPGSGGNELFQTPGDGRTDCGAGCKCSLEYGAGDQPNAWAWVTRLPASWRQDWPEGGQPGMLLPARSDVPLLAHQKQALDTFRQAVAAWDAVRGDLPPLPDMFAFGPPDEGAPEIEFGALTHEQERALALAWQALMAWQIATDMGDAAAFGEADEADTVLLYNPYPRQSGGRYGPGGMHGVSEGGAGESGGVHGQGAAQSAEYHHGGGGGGSSGGGASAHGTEGLTPTRHGHFDPLTSSLVAEEMASAHKAPGLGMSYAQHDVWMERAMHETGADGHPDIVPESELANLKAQGDEEVWRAFATADYAEQFRSGPVYAAHGVSGSGYYVGMGPSGRSEAEWFGRANGNQRYELVHMTIKADARRVTAEALHREWLDEMGHVWHEIDAAKASGDTARAERWRATERLYEDKGRFALLRGYDVITHTGVGVDEYLVVNRTAVRVLR